MTEFKYEIKELEEMLKKLEEVEGVSCLDLQHIFSQLSKDFNSIYPKKILNKENLKSLGLRLLKRKPYLIKEYLFVQETENLLVNLNKLKFLDNTKIIAHHSFVLKNKIIISFNTKYNHLIGQIIKDVNNNTFILSFIIKMTETGEIINNKIKFTFDDFNLLKKEALKIAIMDEIDFFDKFPHI